MRFCTFVVLALVSFRALAQEQPVTVKIGGTVFGEYAQSDLQPSAFQITRGYLNVTGTVTPQISFRITPDITRESSGSQMFRLKYAFAQYTRDAFWVRAGVQQTPYLDFIESMYRYRFQGTLFAEREGFLTSSDAGISARYALPNDRGDVHVGYYNGEGYARAETNDEKALQVRATFRPIRGRGLRLTAFADFDRASADRPRRRYIAHATFEHARGNAGIEYLTARDQVTSRGWSAWATPRLTKSVQALLRYDSMQTPKRQRNIAGVAYWLGATTAILVDRDHSSTDTRYGAHLLLAF
ncbi:MAG TPA: porin [Thermoanaerobaculia bacterium]|nr:porin [Thermoanaerobaculia bacterium]